MINVNHLFKVLYTSIPYEKVTLFLFVTKYFVERDFETISSVQLLSLV